MNISLKLTAFVFLLSLPLPLFGGERIRVACIGDSITYGIGVENRESDSYPAQLREMLGDGYEVCAFGRPGATLLFRGHRPFVLQKEFPEALAYAGDIAVIHLGVNDTDPRDWPDYRDDFTKDYLSLIDSLRKVNPAMRIIIAIPTPIGDRHPRFLSGTRDWLGEIREAVRVVARASACELIDFYEPLHPHISHFRDAVHPDAFAAGIMARVAYSGITGDYGGLALPAVYSDNMVFQRGRPIVISGTADAGQRVNVMLGTAVSEAVTGTDGRWSVTLPPMEASTGLDLTVRTANTVLSFGNIAIGEVWLCSGQSNMRFMLLESAEKDDGLTVCRDEDLRFFDSRARWETNNRQWPAEALEEVDKLQYFKPASWSVSDSLSAAGFSAVGFWFGRVLRDSLKVPVGLICNAVGGATAESWIDRQTLEYCMPEVLRDWLHNDFIQDWARGRAVKNLSAGDGKYTRHPYEPAYLFESAISPLEHFGVKGVVWYQGESNAHNYEAHERLFPLLLKSWQDYFGNPELPFCYVQLSSLNRPSWPWFRDSQRRLLSLGDNLGMVVTSDLGDSLDVHYKSKKKVGERAALWALNYEYGRTSVVPSGPLFHSASLIGDEVKVDFDFGFGLRPSDGKEVTGFELASDDMVFYRAKCRIAGNSVFVSCCKVPSPVYIRYAWEPFTRANLVNGTGLPASTFRSHIEPMDMKESYFTVLPLPEVTDREYAKGVSAPICGTLDGCPVLAGGANFPDKPLLDGGAKKVYKDIWMMLPGKGWTLAGALPDSMAYGASFQAGKRLIVAGGSVSGKPSAAVYRLEKTGARVRVKALPQLPEGVAEAGWALDGEHLFLVGGVSASGKSDAVYHCEKAGGKWSRLASLPVPLVQPVAFASGGKLYVWGGFDPAVLEVYSEGWCLDLSSGEWSSAPGVPDGGTFVGASALPLGDGRLLVTGGVNIDTFRKALHNGPEDRIPYLSMEPAAYKFRESVWIFDAARGEWECAGMTCRTALAGAGIALWNGGALVAGGEIKPGVRSPQIFKLEL